MEEKASWNSWGANARELNPGDEVEFLLGDGSVMRCTVLPTEGNCMAFAYGNAVMSLDPAVEITHNSPPVWPTPKFWRKV